MHSPPCFLNSEKRFDNNSIDIKNGLILSFVFFTSAQSCKDIVGMKSLYAHFKALSLEGKFLKNHFE